MLNQFYNSAARKNYNTGAHQNIADYLLSNYTSKGLVEEPKLWKFLEDFNYTTIMMNSNHTSRSSTPDPKIDAFKFQNQNKDLFLICSGTGYDLVSLEYTLPYTFELTKKKEVQFLNSQKVKITNYKDYYLIVSNKQPPIQLVQLVKNLFDDFPYPEKRILLGLVDATNYSVFSSTSQPKSIIISHPYNRKNISDEVGKVVNNVLSGKTSINKKQVITNIVNKKQFDNTVQVITEIIEKYGKKHKDKI